ncbi:ABC transporter permease [Aureimonas fodinaquatilis]|uniref:ABC transporter permease n=1 Tax=Aureimonas fodinaquatilis TaxID=2565783 RepID=A0A5B0DRL7_9HYPH|nr:ABC transporter permease [Aureimonas fodinaquatilis]KAA0969013.1 ABC transporter permease [Aureimonas fodinaquatilis]
MSIPSVTATAPKERKSLGLRRLTRKLAPLIVIVAILAIWEAVVRIFAIPSFMLPAPSEVFSVGWRTRSIILGAAGQTLLTTLLGFALAVAFGLVAGVIVGSSRVIYDSIYPTLIGFNSIPKVAIIPILVIWVGIGPVPAVITAFLISFFPILVNVATGIATVEPELKDVLRALGASQVQIIRKIGLPRSMPYFFASLKVAISLAFVGSITAESIASNQGIGYLMLVASSRFQVPLAFAGLFVTALMGVGMYAISSAFEKRLTGWTIRDSQSGIGANG